MTGMNWKRIVGGGLVAGLVILVGEFAVEPLMADHMVTFFERLGLPQPGESAMAAFAGLALVLGITSVWLYAAIRPRFGAGARTAVIAATAVWLLSCLLPNTVMYAFGVFTSELFWFASLWPLVETIVAVLAGARVYRE